MSNWATRIKSRMKELDMTQEMLASKMDITRGAITHYLSGRRVPPLKQFQRLATILKVDPAWLQYGTTSAKESAKKTGKKEKSEQMHKIPLLSWDQVTDFIKGKISTGGKLEYIPHFFTDNEKWFALKVKGDSMTSPTNHHKNFHDGEIIIVDPDKIAEHGDFVIAQLTGAKEATFKQYVIDGGVSYLKPNNPQYPLSGIESKTKILGVAIHRLAFCLTT
ncbi:MAG TPA: S24 family peptidase [Gammaproteobacteria bacterium]|nr:S24 family peptidase [Gammaproteobacteria bacterium]